MVSNRARSYLRSRATREMACTVRAERVLKSSGYDEDTLYATAGTRTELFTSPARVWEITSGSTIVVGSADVEVQATQVSVPWDTELLKRDDEFVILTAPHDPSLVGKRFQVQDSAKAGDARPTRRYTVMAVN